MCLNVFYEKNGFGWSNGFNQGALELAAVELFVLIGVHGSCTWLTAETGLATNGCCLIWFIVGRGGTTVWNGFAVLKFCGAVCVGWTFAKIKKKKHFNT